MFKKYLFLVVLLGAATLLTAQNLDAERLPDMKIATVWMDAGFASERTFFRAFKTATGMTPSEWTAIK